MTKYKVGDIVYTTATTSNHYAKILILVYDSERFKRKPCMRLQWVAGKHLPIGHEYSVPIKEMLRHWKVAPKTAQVLYGD